MSCQLQPTVRINSGDRIAIFSLSRHFCLFVVAYAVIEIALPGYQADWEFCLSSIRPSVAKSIDLKVFIYFYLRLKRVCQKLCCCKAAVVSSPDVLGNLPVQ